MSTYHVTEHFVSINGEARRAGELSCFIRLAGCNLHCNYCDTRWSCDPEAPSELLTEEELYQWVKETGVRNVTLTGGEPLLAEGVDRLLKRLGSDPELRIEIETNGSILLESFLSIPGAISFTMDLKCPGSGMAEVRSSSMDPAARQVTRSESWKPKACATNHPSAYWQASCDIETSTANAIIFHSRADSLKPCENSCDWLLSASRQRA